MSGSRPPQLEEFDKDWVPELPASMVARGLAALPKRRPPAPPQQSPKQQQSPKPPPPDISDHDVDEMVDMIGLGVISSWQEFKDMHEQKGLRRQRVEGWK